MNEVKPRSFRGGVDIKPLMRLTLFSLVLLFCCSSLAAYPLYVHPTADTEQADGSEEHPYRYIQDAIDHAFDNTNPDNQDGPSVEIWLADTISIYQENLIVDFCGDSELRDVQDLSIISLGNNPDECKITTSSSGPTMANAIRVISNSSSKFRLQGVTIGHDILSNEFVRRGVYCTPRNSFFQNIGELYINKCKFSTNDTAIEIDVSGSISLMITDSVFDISQHSPFAVSKAINSVSPLIGSSVVLSQNSFIGSVPSSSMSDIMLNAVHIELSGNNFEMASVGLGSYLNANPNVTVISNKFFQSPLTFDGFGEWIVHDNIFNKVAGCPSIVGFSVQGGSNTMYPFIISNNTFSDFTIPIKVRYWNVNNSLRPALQSNSFINCDNVFSLQRHSDMTLNTYNTISEYKNNLYKGVSNNPFIILDQNNQPLILTSDNRIPISHSHFSTQLDTTNPSIVLGDGISYGDPLIDYDEFANTYSLLWDENQKSPLINSGYPGESGELTDPDGTPPDIGSVYYPHVNRRYFDRVSPIMWLSFPVLDDRSNTDGVYWNELGYLFSEHMQDAPNSQLDQIQWSYDSEEPTMEYVIDTWQYSSSRAIQQKGYKVQFNTTGEISDVVVNGFKVDAATTPIVWLAEMEENGVSRPFENWIGYFAPFTQKAGYAFSRLLPGSSRDRYLDYIYSMKTQRWSTCRESASHDSPWIIDPNSYTLSEGEMVSLLLLPDAPQEMFWDLSSSPVRPRDIPKSTAFSFDEKLDYQPIYIEFDPEDMPDEIGLYVDGLCKGAAVVDTSLISVCLYNEASKAGGEIELVFFYEGKGKCVSPAWTVYNSDTMVFEDSSLRADQIGDYAYISFTREEGESSSPLVTSLRQNYPNPFNPSTTISFVLGSDSEARLDIFNARGQLVKSFQYDQLAKGLHTVEWNGKDSAGRSVSSGLYLYKLSSSGTSIVKKMLLVK